jgi:hypothetical protein
VLVQPKVDNRARKAKRECSANKTRRAATFW